MLILVIATAPSISTIVQRSGQAEAMSPQAGPGVIFYEPFNSDTLPSGWSSGDGSWIVNGSGNQCGSGSYAFVSTHTINTAPPQPFNAPLESPTIDLSGVKTAVLEFNTDLKYDVKVGDLMAKVIVETGCGKHVVWCYNKESYNGKVSIDISDIVAGRDDVRLTFMFRAPPVKSSPYESWWQLDDVTIRTKDVGKLRFTSATYSVDEDKGPAIVTVERGDGSYGTLSVSYGTKDGTAVAGRNYERTSGTLTFGDGETSKTITIGILDDGLNSIHKDFTISLTNPSVCGSLGSPSTATVTVINTDPVPVVQFSAASYTAGESDGNATITVSKVNDADGPISVFYTTSDGTAVQGLDYLPASGTLVFGQGEFSKTFKVPLVDNGLYEPDETVSLALSDPKGGASIGARGTSVLTIKDDDPATAIQFSSSAYSVDEDGGNATITVTRTNDAASPVSVNYATRDGTASAGSDYIAAIGALTFSPGEFTKSFKVPILEDSLYEPDETVNLTLSAPTGGAIIGTPGSAVLTINDNDPAPVVYFSSSTYGVDEDGGVVAITVSRANDAEGQVSVDYATSDGTATQGKDYTAASGTLTFSKGEFSKSFEVRILDDGLYEPDETVNLALSNAAGGAGIGTPGSAVLTIRDDRGNDLAPVIQFSMSEYFVSEDGHIATITATRVNDAQNPITVSYTTKPGTAIPDEDYFETSGTLTFSQGEMSKTFDVTILNDADAEPTESVDLELSAPTGGAVLGEQKTAVLNILDNDQNDQQSFTIQLKKGWNLISFPLVNDSVWASQFTGTAISTVLSYDRVSGNFTSYLVGISPPSYDINLRTDSGYFLYCEEDTFIVIYGSLPDHRSIDIFPGWNLIGWSSLSTSNAKTVCGKMDGSQTIDHYINPVDNYESYIEGISPDEYSFDMIPGEGYFIYSESENIVKYTF
ncbi:hypothetical protein MCP_2796 [Methanocella paludicola SANAE]|uniref:Calx-beta domain-containing protein n=1 Tax=Methanocella paludicola (strain DSM 17711 / JCM 13418 / NBRC 101707 / SANAE) TaxID=304371 RepID=D1Z2E6_METPS|nr:Calx-beta domain-containing protein [Methanocella paludicola]BAI62868.1 hypothetical protein MCP_2796 [Methanocella paludicola SANAE]